MDGANEVAWPVITSTLTTVGAFFPLIFWPGIMGEVHELSAQDRDHRPVRLAVRGPGGQPGALGALADRAKLPKGLDNEDSLARKWT